MAMTGAALGYEQMNAAGAVPHEPGLIRIANQVIESAQRIDQIAGLLQNLSQSVHGPRPEPVSVEANRIKGEGSDSLAGRAQTLTEAVDRLQRALDSLTR